MEVNAAPCLLPLAESVEVPSSWGCWTEDRTGCVCTPVHVRACQSLAGTVVRYILRRHTPACYRFEASTWESLELGVILHFLVDMTSAEIGKMDK